MKEEEEEKRLCVPAVAPTVPQTMDERLNVGSENTRRKILAKDGSSRFVIASDLSGIDVEEEEEKENRPERGKKLKKRPLQKKRL